MLTPVTKKNRYIFYEKSPASSTDLLKYVDLNMPKDISKQDSRLKYDQHFAKLYHEGVKTLPGMFEADAKKIANNKHLNDYNTTLVPLGYGSTPDTIQKYSSMTKPGDQAIIMGHSDPENSNYGRSSLNNSNIWNINEECDVSLGTCHGDEAGQAAANALNRPVTAQNDSNLWSGTQVAKTQNASMFYDYKTKKDKSKLYYPNL